MRISNFFNFINEDLDFKMVETKFIEIEIPSLFIPGEKDKIFRFISTKGNSYDLYFCLTLEDNCQLSNGRFIRDYDSPIPTIFFSLTERGLDPLTFDDLTNRSEKFEVMGKITWLISQYGLKYSNNIFSIGEVDSKKYQFYLHYLHNLPQFSLTEGYSKNYGGKKCYYLVK